MAVSSPSILPHISVFLFTIICINVANPWPRTNADDSFRRRLRNDTDSIKEASHDYGNIVHEIPSSVLQPSSVQDIIDLIINPISTIAARGCGHSINGQAMTDRGVVVNMTALNKTNGSSIKVVTNSPLGFYADVGGEQLWIDVLQATLEHGLAPDSWTDYLYMSVGGTLSNAGISGQAFLHGPQINNVLQLDVVTGKGKHITCSPKRNQELFFGVLGGLGQFGIITRARIILDKAPTRVKMVTLLYSNFSTFTRDQEYLIISSNFPSYVEGFLMVNESTTNLWSSSSPPINKSDIVALLKNHNILYAIELAKYYDNQTANTIDQEFRTLLKKLNFIPELKFNTDVSFFDFLHRVGNLDTPQQGSLLSHPWLNLFVSKSHIVDFNTNILATMLPRLNQTTGIFIFYPLNKKKWDDRMSAVIPDDDNQDVFYTLGLLHSTPSEEYQSIDKFNDEILDVCEKAGIKVKKYLPHYKTKKEWENHFGSKWITFCERKKLFDPKWLLSPGQRIFRNLEQN